MVKIGKSRILFLVIVLLALLTSVVVYAEKSGGEAAPERTVAITIAADAQGYTWLNLPEGEAVAPDEVLAGVSAVDEKGKAVAVTVADMGGLDLQNPQRPEGPVFPATPYWITYEARHPVTGEVFTITREAYVTIGFMPVS